MDILTGRVALLNPVLALLQTLDSPQEGRNLFGDGDTYSRELLLAFQPYVPPVMLKDMAPHDCHGLRLFVPQ